MYAYGYRSEKFVVQTRVAGGDDVRWLDLHTYDEPEEALEFERAHTTGHMEFRVVERTERPVQWRDG